MARSVFKTAIALCIGIVTALVGFELVFTALPVNRAAWGGLATPDWRGPRLQPNPSATFSQDWDMSESARVHINALGFHSALEYKDGAPIVALTGDSYIQALMIPDDQTIDARLNAERNDNPVVYNFGIGGAQLPTYAGLAAEASRRYSVKGLVITISRNDIYEATIPVKGFYNYVQEGNQFGAMQYQPPEAQRSLGKSLAMKSSLLNYFRGNLKIDQTPVFKGARPDTGKDAAPETHTEPMSAEACRVVYDHFIAELPGVSGVPREKIVLIFDGQRSLLYPGGVPSPAFDTLCLPAFASAARAAGYGVIDLETVFKAEYAQRNRRFDYWPRDVHWNTEAHRVVARELAAQLRERHIWH